MLRINRLRVEIQTKKGMYGFDEKFYNKLNLLASEDNTCGKSSVLEGLYYCLGFEEIIGGRGEKVLTSAYKTFIEDGNEKLAVLESKVYLEISNCEEDITIYRSAKLANRDSKLVTVYYSSIEKIFDENTLVKDFYVHMQNAANNKKGFHHFLEEFLHLELPLVPSSDGNQRKLYLQLIFSCMFIEQKHGWGDIFSGIPVLGIKDAKKRVLEFVLNLDTLNNERKKEFLRIEENKIKKEWEFHERELSNLVKQANCSIIGVQQKPCIIDKLKLSGIHITKNNIGISNYITKLEEEYQQLNIVNPKVVDNFENLQEELEGIEEDLEKFEKDILFLKENYLKEELSVNILDDNIEIIESDLRNNKDAARLRNLGSDLNCMTSDNICPICSQQIEDTLLPVIEGLQVMSIDENIRHLEAQREMMIFAREGHIKNKIDIENKIKSYQSKLFKLRRLAKVIRSDLYSVDESISEAIVYKKIELESEKEDLEKLNKFLEDKKEIFSKLSTRWKKFLNEKEKVPKKKLSDLDIEKINILCNKFILNLKKYGYKSVANVKDINISDETYLPIIEGFDMKFDSSASDNIRAIWAYTIALMQTSLEKDGNHPNVLIFDEPNQHSIIPNDMKNFFQSITQLDKNSQTIVGVTTKDIDTKKIIENLPKGTFNLICIGDKAFKKL